MPDKLLAEYRPTMPTEVLHLWAVDAIALITALKAKVEALENSIKTVQRAAKTIMIHEADELQRLRQERVQWHQAIASLESERQANAMLTEQVEALENRPVADPARLAEVWTPFKDALDADRQNNTGSPSYGRGYE